MGSRLRDIEAARRKEERQAQRWVDKQGVGALPGRRTETGETAAPQRVGHHGDPTQGGLRDPDLPRKHRDDVSYDTFGSLSEYEDWLLAHGNEYLPLVSSAQGEPTLDTLEKRARMHHVLTSCDPVRVELLYRRHVEQMTLEGLAVEYGVSRQAIAKRLDVAEAEFRGAFADHWNDDVVWEDV